MVLVFFFLNLKTPRDDFKTKMERMDWVYVNLSHLQFLRLSHC